MQMGKRVWDWPQGVKEGVWLIRQEMTHAMHDAGECEAQQWYQVKHHSQCRNTLGYHVPDGERQSKSSPRKTHGPIKMSFQETPKSSPDTTFGSKTLRTKHTTNHKTLIHQFSHL